MTDQPTRFPRFFITADAPCPYLPGRTERKIFAELRGRDAARMSEGLGRIGFRRSQNVVYRPACEGCSACVSVRIVAREFVPTASQRRLLRRHADLDVAAADPWATEEQFELLKAYLRARHPGGGMASMDAYDFAEMIETSPVETVVVEYREPSTDGRPGRLVGACLTDKQSDGLSMVYSFYDTERPGRPGLGTFIILDHVLRAAQVGLPFVYLGYWVSGSARMDYKRRFHPLEALSARGWSRLPQWRPEPAQAEPEATHAARAAL